MNALGIDPKNLKFELRQEWLMFQSGRVKPFISAWLQKELSNEHTALENVLPIDLGRSQGAISAIKRMINLVEQKFCDEILKDVVAFLEKER